MTARAYTVRFIGTQGLVDVIGYTVPAGYRAVVRDADVYAHDGILSTTHVFLKDLVEGHTFFYANNRGLDGTPTPTYAHWSGRAVFEPGDQFGFQSDGFPWDVSCAGYLFVEE